MATYSRPGDRESHRIGTSRLDKNYLIAKITDGRVLGYTSIHTDCVLLREDSIGNKCAQAHQHEVLKSDNICYSQTKASQIPLHKRSVPIKPVRYFS